jgi:hypothetical protein
MVTINPYLNFPPAIPEKLLTFTKKISVVSFTPKKP